MEIKRVVVHLDSGAARPHELEVEDDLAYAAAVNKIADDLIKEWGAFVFTTPSLGIYRLRNIVGIEFLDPLPPDKQLPIGFRPASK